MQVLVANVVVERYWPAKRFGRFSTADSELERRVRSLQSARSGRLDGDRSKKLRIRVPEERERKPELNRGACTERVTELLEGQPAPWYATTGMFGREMLVVAQSGGLRTRSQM